MFRLQKYKKFESNSQLNLGLSYPPLSCFDCKSTKNLRAIHNFIDRYMAITQLFRLQKYKKFESNSQQWTHSKTTLWVVSTAKVQKIWEQFTTLIHWNSVNAKLFRLQKYKKFESNSQLTPITLENYNVVSTAKVQKIWEQFTTDTYWKKYYLCCFDCKSTKNLRAIHNSYLWFILEKMLFRLQKYKKFESNSQRYMETKKSNKRCFDCKSTKNLRAIHNAIYLQRQPVRVVSTAKVQKIWEQFTTHSL